MSKPATKQFDPLSYIAALACALVGAALFQFFGNAGRGYIDTVSLFYWWGYQWANLGSESEHGWLILGLSAWLVARNLRARDEGEGRGAGKSGRWPGASGEGQVAGTSGRWQEARGEGRVAMDDSKHGQSAIGNRQSAISAWHSAMAMAAGLALHALGFVAQQARISILALLLFTWGVLRLGGGRRWGAAAVFPLGFMVFAIPINVFDSLGFWLRVWVVDASGLIARAVGITVLQSGTQLVAPDGAYHYDVAAACSGIRSLTAMAALSLLAGYLNFHGWWRRALVLLLCFPLVYVGNVARIVAIIFAAEAGGHKWGDLAHEVMGYGVFVIVLGGVLGAISLLRRRWPERVIAAPPAAGSGEVCHPLDDKKSDGSAVGEKLVCHLMDDKRAWVVAGVIVGLAVGEMAWLRQVARSPARGRVGVELAADGLNPVELPAFLGTEWIGRRAEVSAVEREILPPDTGYSRKQYVAVADARKRVFLSIVLSGRDRTSIHRPELCLVGQGWTIADTAAHRFTYPGRGADEAFPATLLRLRRELQTPRGKVVVPQLVAYWFVGGDGVVGSHGQRLWRDSWNRVVHGRADRWAYVLMQTDATDGEAAALARMQAVLNETLPVFAPQVFATQKP